MTPTRYLPMLALKTLLASGLLIPFSTVESAVPPKPRTLKGSFESMKNHSPSRYWVTMTTNDGEMVTCRCDHKTWFHIRAESSLELIQPGTLLRAEGPIADNDFYEIRSKKFGIFSSHGPFCSQSDLGVRLVVGNQLRIYGIVEQTNPLVILPKQKSSLGATPTVRSMNVTVDGITYGPFPIFGRKFGVIPQPESKVDVHLDRRFIKLAGRKPRITVFIRPGGVAGQVEIERRDPLTLADIQALAMRTR